MSDPNAENAELCAECLRELAPGRGCDQHVDASRIETAKQNVKDLLRDLDDEALTRRQRRAMAIGSIPAIAFYGIVILATFGGVALPSLLTKAAFVVLVVTGVGIGRRWANRTFRPRFTRWTGSDYTPDKDVEALLADTRKG